MAKVKLLVDTDIWIDYFNSGSLSALFETDEFEIYYSVVTKKQLLSKRGLRDAERRAILLALRRHKQVPLDGRTTRTYSVLRRTLPSMEKEDAPVAACALSRGLPLVTRNWKHFERVEGLELIPSTKWRP